MHLQPDLEKAPPQRSTAISVKGASKAYGALVALDKVDFSVDAGEVRALLGKNGAGKSTLVRLMSGATQPDQGGIEIAGTPVRLSSPVDALARGVATVHQELTIIPELTVAENIFLGRWAAASGARGVIDYRRLNMRAADVLATLGLSINPASKAGNLSIAHRQVVEIARAISEKPRVLILDEPTSSLPHSEVDLLLTIVRRLAKQGIAVIYVSHRMDEIPRIANSITVLRDGRHVATKPLAELPTENVIKLMTGAFQPQRSRRTPAKQNVEAVLEARDLSTKKLSDVTFTLHRGEILGLAGLLGSGRTELLRAAFGLDRLTSGTLTIQGAPILRSTPRSMIERGVGLAPEERKREGLVMGMSIAGNLVLSSLDKVSRLGFLSANAEVLRSSEAVKRLSIKIPSLGAPVASLSGGNQQKVVLGKCLGAGVSILLLDEPTRGVDVEAKNQIYSLLRTLADEGMSIIVASSELEELFIMCDRLLVLSQGTVVAERDIGETSLEDTMRLAMEGVSI